LADSVVQVLDERGEGHRLSKADFTTGISSEGNLHHRHPVLFVGDLMFWFVVVLKFQAR